MIPWRTIPVHKKFFIVKKNSLDGVLHAKTVHWTVLNRSKNVLVHCKAIILTFWHPEMIHLQGSFFAEPSNSAKTIEKPWLFKKQST